MVRTAAGKMNDTQFVDSGVLFVLAFMGDSERQIFAAGGETYYYYFIDAQPGVRS